MNNRMKNNTGFTLVEMLVYLALFAFIMTSTLAGAYQIIEHGGRTRVLALRVEEEYFVIRKIANILNNTATIEEPEEEGDSLTIQTPHGQHHFEIQGNQIYLDGEPLSTEVFDITNLQIKHGVSPESVTITFNTDGNPSPTSTFLVR